MHHMIALVEDSPRDAETVRSHLTRIARESGIQYELKWFKKGGEFLSSYQPIYDIVLLDIQLPDLSGMDVAKILRGLDDKVILIFITSLAQYAVEGYEVSAMDFIVKPVTYSVFQRKFQRATARIQQEPDESILLSLRDGVQYRTSPSQIKYIEIQGHTLMIHTTRGALEAYGSLNHLEPKLNPLQFVRCHRSFLVNLAFVRAVRGLIVSVDDEELPIAKLKREEFMQALNRYLGRST